VDVLKSFVFILLTIVSISPLWPIGPALPGDPFIIVNKQTNEVAFIKDSEVKKIYKAATGKTDDLTPEGMFTVTVKAINPYYRKLNISGGSPKNPLGTRWIGFDALNTNGRTYWIHGTNNPHSIGYYASLGCIRLRNEDVEELYELVPIGTKIFITKTWKNFEQIGTEKGVIYP
jgi:lipoprotein-anchoring transpeptidase ErfK/SrfK